MDNPRPVGLSLLSKVSSKQTSRTVVLLKLEPVFAFYNVFACNSNAFAVGLEKVSMTPG